MVGKSMIPPWRKFYISIFTASLSTLLATSAMAREGSVGSVVKVVKDVQITTDDGDERKVERRAEIFPGDYIKTGDEAWLTINFFDLTRVVLRPNTEFLVKKFPQTMDQGEIELEFVTGGARVTSGTIANQTSDRFKIITPDGELEGARSEWVVRSCEAETCVDFEASLKQCRDFIHPELEDRRFISAYKGNIATNFCPVEVAIDAGTTLIFDPETEACEVIEEVPCFILFDGKMGKDKARKLQRQLTYTEEALKERPDRPDSRPNRPRRPRVDRPNRRRR